MEETSASSFAFARVARPGTAFPGAVAVTLQGRLRIRFEVSGRRKLSEVVLRNGKRCSRYRVGSRSRSAAAVASLDQGPGDEKDHLIIHGLVGMVERSEVRSERPPHASASSKRQSRALLSPSRELLQVIAKVSRTKCNEAAPEQSYSVPFQLL